MKFTRTDHMQLLPHMQDVGSDIIDEIEEKDIFEYIENLNEKFTAKQT